MLQLVRGTECYAFKTFEDAGHWLLAQAGVRNVRIKRRGGRWRLVRTWRKVVPVMATTSVMTQADPSSVAAIVLRTMV